MNMTPVEDLDPRDCTFQAALEELESELSWRERNWRTHTPARFSRMQRLKTAISIVRGRMATPNIANTVRPRFDLLVEWDDKSSVMHSGHFSSVQEVAEYLQNLPGDRNFRWWLNGIDGKELMMLAQTGESYSVPADARPQNGSGEIAVY